MGNKIIFELKLNETDSIIAYEKRNYDTCYEDSRLYICVGGQKIKFVEGSFCDGFGLEMYYRVFNIKEFDETSNFGEKVEEYDNSLIFNDEYNPEDPDSKAFFVSTDFDPDNYIFAYGKSKGKFLQLYLFKNKNGYKVVFLEINDAEPPNYKVKVLNEFFIDEDVFAEWKRLICTEWEKRKKIEAARSGHQQSDEKWQKFFEYMRSDD